MTRREGLRRAHVLAAAAFWLAVAALSVGQTLTMRLPPGVRIRPLEVVVWTGGLYALWVPLTLAIWRMTAGWLPAAIGWPRYLVRHVTLGSVVILLHLTALLAFATLILGPNPAEPFLMMLRAQIRSRLYLEFIIYSGVVACGHALWLHEEWRQREAQARALEAELAQARLGALEAQLQPHFLFNSLHTIASLARDGRNADVVKMVADLSDLLRAVIDQPATTRPLREEVDVARRYLDIQRVRFGDRLAVTFDVDPSAASATVPALTLQPLVDNAIRHGIAPNVAGGTIFVRARQADGALSIAVEDDGAGVAPGWSLDQAGGSGLANLRSRLEIIYQGRARFDAAPRAEGGFRVLLTTPVTP